MEIPPREQGGPGEKGAREPMPASFGRGRVAQPLRRPGSYGCVGGTESCFVCGMARGAARIAAGDTTAGAQPTARSRFIPAETRCAGGRAGKSDSVSPWSCFQLHRARCQRSLRVTSSPTARGVAARGLAAGGVFAVGPSPAGGTGSGTLRREAAPAWCLRPGGAAPCYPATAPRAPGRGTGRRGWQGTGFLTSSRPPPAA